MRVLLEPITPALIEEITRRIVQTANPDLVILFGSQATGKAREDSDVDLLIVEREPFGPNRSRRKEFGRLMAALRGMGIAKDLLIFSRDEFEEWRDARNHVIAEAVREGKILYERA